MVDWCAKKRLQGKFYILIYLYVQMLKINLAGKFYGKRPKVLVSDNAHTCLSICDVCSSDSVPTTV